MALKVCAIVINSVSHDIRVLKEAESLREAGYDVSIIGIQDANATAPFEQTESGVSIYRAAWRAQTARPRIYFYFGWIVGALVIAAAFWFLPRDFVASVYSGIVVGVRWVLAHLEESPVLIVAQILITIAAVYFAWRGFRRFRAKRATYSNLSMTEVSVQLPLTEEEKARVNRQPQRPFLHLSPFFFVLSRFPTHFSLMARQIMVARRERAIADLVTKMNPDIVHCHDIGALPVGVLVKARTRCKLVFDAHEIYDQLAQTTKAESALNRYMATLYGDRVDAFITINDSIATYYQRHFSFLPKPIIVRNAVHPAETFQYDGRLHEAAKLEPGAKILLYQGGFAQRRGLIALVQSAPFLPDDWTIVMMGWGRLEDQLRRTARDAMMAMNKAQVSRYHRIELPRDRVRFIPPAPQEELPMWTAGATIGIIPYENVGLNHWFCTPNKLWEYPNAGVPILASPFPEMRKIVQGYGIGWLLPTEITGEGVAATLSQISDEDIAQARANCGRFISEDNWTIYGSRLVKLYGDLKTGPTPLRAAAE